MMSLIQTLRRNLREQRLIAIGESILVGVSGGVDSLALMHALAGLRSALHMTLFVATLDHQLRGASGDDDARFVEATAREWGVPCERGSIDVRALAAERGIGIEQAARLARYTFLASVANGLGIAKVAVAHHAEDQAETVLLHLVRGAGLNGLAGMRWISPLPTAPDLQLIRPLLNIRRGEIEDYARQFELTPRHDATNADTTYSRNRLRAEAIPLLRTINADVDAALVRLADNAASDESYLEAALRSASAGWTTFLDERVVLKRAEFLALHSALQRRLILRAAHHILMSADDLVVMVAHERVLAAVALAESGEVGAVAELGRGLRLRIDYDRLFVEFEGEPAADSVDTALTTPETELLLAPPASVELQGWRLQVERWTPDPSAARGEGIALAAPHAATVRLRTRRPGDTLRVALGEGQIGTQSLSKWMINVKIPAALRDQIPLLLVDDQVAAVLWKGIILGADYTLGGRDHAGEILHLMLTPTATEIT
ncbi:MAG: tRNA lysidine(34) synthetase TilS [Anaerolineae bacterium]|nr:tRNA lysidine(34) synthetase TilS [Anaerolineae bacterium]